MSRREPNPDLEAAMEHFFAEARLNLFPKLKAARFAVAVMDGRVDAKLALEIGASLLLDKPILLVMQKGIKLAPRLRMVADEVIEYETIRDPITQAAMAAAIQRMLEKKP
jgi:hypothetical protein